jgi:hypothetical protein
MVYSSTSYTAQEYIDKNIDKFIGKVFPEGACIYDVNYDWQGLFSDMDDKTSSATKQCIQTIVPQYAAEAHPEIGTDSTPLDPHYKKIYVEDETWSSDPSVGTLLGKYGYWTRPAIYLSIVANHINKMLDYKQYWNATCHAGNFEKLKEILELASGATTADGKFYSWWLNDSTASAWDDDNNIDWTVTTDSNWAQHICMTGARQVDEDNKTIREYKFKSIPDKDIKECSWHHWVELGLPKIVLAKKITSNDPEFKASDKKCALESGDGFMWMFDEDQGCNESNCIIEKKVAIKQDIEMDEGIELNNKSVNAPKRVFEIKVAGYKYEQDFQAKSFIVKPAISGGGDTDVEALFKTAPSANGDVRLIFENIEFNKPAKAPFSGPNFTITDCKFNNLTSPLIPGSNWKIVNSEFNDTKTPIQIALVEGTKSKSILISNNSFYISNAAGIKLDYVEDSNIIVNNYHSGSYISISNPGITTESHKIEYDMPVVEAEKAEFLTKCGTSQGCYKLHFKKKDATSVSAAEIYKAGKLLTSACNTKGFDTIKLDYSKPAWQPCFYHLDETKDSITVWLNPNVLSQDGLLLGNLESTLILDAVFFKTTVDESGARHMGSPFAEVFSVINYIGQYTDPAEQTALDEEKAEKTKQAKKIAEVYVQAILDSEIGDANEGFCKPYKCKANDSACLKSCSTSAGCQNALSYFCSFNTDDYSTFKCKPLSGYPYPGIKFPEDVTLDDLQILKEVDVFIKDTKAYKNSCEAMTAEHFSPVLGGKKVEVLGGTGAKCPDGFKPLGGTCVVTGCPVGLVPSEDQTSCVCKTVGADINHNCECPAGTTKKINSETDFKPTCIGIPTPNTCQLDSECTDGKICKDGLCTSVTPGKLKESCAATNDCAEGHVCDETSHECQCDIANNWMFNSLVGQCTHVDPEPPQDDKTKCLDGGGTWDAINQSCNNGGGGGNTPARGGCAISTPGTSAQNAASLLPYLLLLIGIRFGKNRKNT